VNYSQLQSAILGYVQDYETSFILNIPTFVEQAEQRIYNTVQIPALRKNVTGNIYYDLPGAQYLACPSDFLSVFSLAIINNRGSATTESYEYLINKDVNYLRAAYPNSNARGMPRYYALFGPTVTNYTPTTELSFIVAPTPDITYDVEMHYYYYPETIVQGKIIAFGFSPGTGYTNGVFYGVPLTGGSGSGATATIVVAGNVVTNITIENPGSFYVNGDVLGVAQGSVLGTGVNFSLTVTAISNSAGRSWLGDNYDPVLLYGTLVEAYTYLKGEQDVMAFYEKKYQEALGQLNRLGTGLERGDAYRDGQAKIKVNP